MYNKYLKTEHWKKVKNNYKKTQPFICWVCNTKKKLNIHHLTYKNLWKEELEDLIVLCTDHHHLLHSFTGKHEANKDIDSLREAVKQRWFKRNKKRRSVRDWHKLYKATGYSQKVGTCLVIG